MKKAGEVLVPKVEDAWNEVERAMKQLGGTEASLEDNTRSWKVPGALVHLRLDEALGVELVVVEGPQRKTTTKRLRQLIRCYEPSDVVELFAEAGENPDDVYDSLGLLAAVAENSRSPELVALFLRALENEDPMVRERAALLATVPAWPELRSRVAELAKTSPDPDLRETAKVALRGFRKSASGQAQRSKTRRRD